MATAATLRINIEVHKTIVEAVKKIDNLAKSVTNNTTLLESNKKTLETVTKAHDEVSKSANSAGDAFAKVSDHINKANDNLNDLGKTQQAVNSDFEEAGGIVGAYRSTMSGIGKVFNGITSAIYALRSGIYTAIDVFEKLTAIFERYPILGKITALALEGIALKLAEVVSRKTNSRVLKLSILFYKLASAVKFVRKTFERFPFLADIFKGLARALGASVVNLGETSKSVKSLLEMFYKLREGLKNVVKDFKGGLIGVAWIVIKVINKVTNTIAHFAEMLGLPTDKIYELRNSFLLSLASAAKLKEKLIELGKDAAASVAKFGAFATGALYAASALDKLSTESFKIRQVFRYLDATLGGLLPVRLMNLGKVMANTMTLTNHLRQEFKLLDAGLRLSTSAVNKINKSAKMLGNTYAFLSNMTTGAYKTSLYLTKGLLDTTLMFRQFGRFVGSTSPLMKAFTSSIQGTIKAGAILGPILVALGGKLEATDILLLGMIGKMTVLVGIITGNLASGFIKLVSLLGDSLLKAGTKVVNSLQNMVKEINQVDKGIYVFNRTMQGLYQASFTATGGLDEWTKSMSELRNTTKFAYPEIRKATLEIVAAGMQLGITKEQMGELLKISADYAAFSGDDLVKTTINFVSALNGQSQSVLKYGVKLSQASLQQHAYASGLDKTISSMSEKEKIQLRFNTVLDQYIPVAGTASAITNTLAGQEELLARNLKYVYQEMARGAAVIENTNLVTFALNNVLGLIPNSLFAITGFLGTLVGRAAQVIGFFLKWSFAIAGVVKGYSLLKMLLQSDLAKTLFFKNIPFVNKSFRELLILTGLNVSKMTTLGGAFAELGRVSKGVLISLIKTMTGVNVASLGMVDGLKKVLGSMVGLNFATASLGKTLLISLVAGIEAVGAALMSLLANPIVLLIAGITLALYGLWKAFKLIYDYISVVTGSMLGVTNSFGGFLDVLKTVGFAIYKFFAEPIAQALRQVIGLFTYFISFVIEGLAKLIRVVVKASSALSEFFGYGGFGKGIVKDMEAIDKAMDGLQEELKAANSDIGKVYESLKKLSEANRKPASIKIDLEGVSRLESELKNVGKTQLALIEEERKARLAIADELAKAGGKYAKRSAALRTKIELDFSKKKSEIDAQLTQKLEQGIKDVGLTQLQQINKEKEKRIAVLNEVAKQSEKVAYNYGNYRAAIEKDYLLKRKNLEEEITNNYLQSLGDGILNIGKTQLELIEAERQARLKLLEETAKKSKEIARRSTEIRIKIEKDFNAKKLKLEQDLAKKKEDIAKKAFEAEKKRAEELARVRAEQARVSQAASDFARSNPWASMLGKNEAYNKKKSFELGAIDRAQGAVANAQFAVSNPIAAGTDAAGAASAASSAASGLDAALKTRKDSTLDNVMNIAGGVGEDMLAGVTQGAEGAKKVLSNVATAAFGPVGGMVTDMLMQGPEHTKQMATQFMETMPKLIDAIADALPVLIEVLVEQAPKMLIKVLAKLPRLVGKTFEILGKLIVKGLVKAINGIGSIFKKLFKFKGGKGAVEKFIHLDFPFVKFAKGGLVGGKTKAGSDSEVNDKVPALLSAGEIVIPKSVARGPLEGIMDYVQTLGVKPVKMGLKRQWNKLKKGASSAATKVQGVALSGWAKMNSVAMKITAELSKIPVIGRVFKSINKFQELIDSLIKLGMKVDIPAFVKSPKKEAKRIINEGKERLEPNFKKMLNPAKILGFADGGMVKRVPSGYPNDTFPARLSSNELVIDKSTTTKLKRSLDKEEKVQSIDLTETNNKLDMLIDLLRRPQTINSDVSLNRKTFASIILELNRNGARLAV